jgi:hypothetical protein
MPCTFKRINAFLYYAASEDAFSDALLPKASLGTSEAEPLGFSGG